MRRLFSRPLWGLKNKHKPQVTILHDGALPGALAGSFLPVDIASTLPARNTRLVHEVRGRIWLSLVGFGVIFLVLGVRLAEVTLLQSPGEPSRPQFAAEGSQKNLKRIEIIDRNGRYLAMNRQVQGLAVETRDVWSIEETAQKLAMALPDLDGQVLARRLASHKYVVLRQTLSDEEKQAVMKLGLPGVTYPELTKRVYPQGRLGAHVVGYTVAGIGGAGGLEVSLDSIELDKGNKLVASIDVTAQQILTEELSAAKDNFQARAAWGVIMDVRNGEVIALASLPDYNPNDPGSSPAAHWRNRAMYDLYELGSAFKVLTAASALEAGSVDTKRLYDVRKPLPVYDRVITDYHPKGGYMNLSQIVQYSSNIGMAQVALELGAREQQKFLRALGLMKPLETELPEKRMSLLPRRWGPVETATISYGHGIAVTPLQLTAAVSAVVNGGVYRAPTFFKTNKPKAGTRVFSEATSATMRLILRRVITDGTARRAEAQGYYVIGKTATADKPSPKGGYKENERLSSFVGAFPGYDPRYVLLVSFDEPQPTKKTYGYATAGIVAAPVFQKIVTRLGPVMDLAPVSDDFAFAQFMADFSSKEPVQLAMSDEKAGTAGKSTELDDMAKLIKGLTP